MTKQITIQFEVNKYSILQLNIKLNDDNKSIVDVCENLLIKEYIEKDNPEVSSKEKQKLDNNKIYQRYNLRLEDDVYKRLAIKMNKENDKYINNLVIKLLEKNGYFKDPTKEN